MVSSDGMRRKVDVVYVHSISSLHKGQLDACADLARRNVRAGHEYLDETSDVV